MFEIVVIKLNSRIVYPGIAMRHFLNNYPLQTATK